MKLWTRPSTCAFLIEAAVVPEREEFMSIAGRDGLKAAIAWRDNLSDD